MDVKYSMTISMMMPMSIRCDMCGEYLYKGTKFLTRKETVLGEDYLGLRIFRFYFKCTACRAVITIKTDPKESGYVVESGASRNFEPWKAHGELEEEMRQARMASECADAMMRLENRALDNHIEMQIRDGLDEIQALNARHEAMDQAQLLQAVQKAHGEKADGAAAEVEILASADRVIRIEDDQPLLPSARFCAGKRIELNKAAGEGKRSPCMCGHRRAPQCHRRCNSAAAGLEATRSTACAA